MKRTSLIFSYLIITCTVLFAQHQEVDTASQNQNKIILHQEGFIAGTLIKTLHGDVPIEELCIGDMVIGYDNDTGYVERVIISTSRNFASQHIRVGFNNTIYDVGSHQRFYDFSDNKWISAEQIVANNNGQSQIIHEDTTLYLLTVEGETFCLAPDGIVAHNVAAIAPIAMMGSLVAYNPVSLTIGAAIALACIARKSYEFFNNCSPEIFDAYLSGQSIPGLITERDYYYSRKDELRKILNEFEQIIQGLQRISVSRQSNAALTCALLGSVKYVPSISIAEPSFSQEINYTDAQKKFLRRQREADLIHMEQEIIKMQLTLMLHLNELIGRRNRTLTELIEEMRNAKHGTKQWSSAIKISDINNPNALAIQYEKAIYVEQLIRDVQIQCAELALVMSYYKSVSNNSLMRKTTNIFSILPSEEADNNRALSYIERYAKINDYNKAAIQKHSLVKQVALAAIENKVKEKQNTKRAKEISDAQSRRGSIQPNLPPTDPEKDPEDDEDKNGFNSKSTPELLKSRRTLSERLEEHVQKLAEFIQDPDKFDNKNYLKNAPHRRDEIINRRVAGLNHEIREFRSQIEAINRVLARRGL